MVGVITVLKGCSITKAEKHYSRKCLWTQYAEIDISHVKSLHAVTFSASKTFSVLFHIIRIVPGHKLLS